MGRYQEGIGGVGSSDAPRGSISYGRLDRHHGRFRRGSSQRGAVAVEFAIILPLLLLLVGGVIEFGIVFSQLQVYQGGAREAARCASVQGGGFSNCDVYDTLVAHIGTYAPPAASAVRVAVVDAAGTPVGSRCSNATVGDNVQVSWNQNFVLNIPFWGSVTTTRTILGVFRCE